MTVRLGSDRCARLGALGLLLSTMLLGACAGTESLAKEPTVFYPEAPDSPRIQFLRTISVDTDIETGASGLDELLFGERGTYRGVMAPYGVEYLDGAVYVCDIQQGVVLKIDLANELFDYIKVSGRGRLQKPVNLDFAPDGTLYVADLGRRQIVALDAEGEYLREFGPFDETSQPTDVEVVGDLLYIADSGSRCVRVISRSSGEEVGLLTEAGTGGPRPRAPTNLSVGPDGRIYVVDSLDCVIYVWDKDREFVRVIGTPGDTVGQFARPKGIAWFEDSLFVVDAAFENCQIFDFEGNPRMFFGGSGVGPGNLYLPAGVWVGDEGLELFEDRIDADFSAEGLIIVTSQFGPRKVNFYAFGSWHGGEQTPSSETEADAEAEPEAEADAAPEDAPEDAPEAAIEVEPTQPG